MRININCNINKKLFAVIYEVNYQQEIDCNMNEIM